MPPAAPGEAPGNGAQPAWKHLKGTRRVQAEFKHLSKDIQSGKFGFIKELSLAGDDLMTWRLKLWHFDEDCKGGKNLNRDLEKLNKKYGQDHILMEISFPQDYPHQPFFIRVVSPRCVMYTGHVTAGGSICLESLTLSGTPGSWQPDFSVESLLNVILINMIDCPVTVVQTATGPGGVSGPLRVDFNCGRPTMGYSSTEAKAAFARTLENHKRMGWGGDSSGNAGQAGAGNAPAGLRHRQAHGIAARAAAAGAAAASRFGFGMGSNMPLMGSPAAAGGSAPDGRKQLKRRTHPTAAGAAAACSDDDDYNPHAAAAAGAAAEGSSQGLLAGLQRAGTSQQQHQKQPSPVKRMRAAAVGAAGQAASPAEVIALLSDSEDEELQAAMEESLKMANGNHAARSGPAAAAAAAAAAATNGSARRRYTAAAALWGHHIDDDDGVLATAHHASAGRQRERQRNHAAGQRQPATAAGAGAGAGLQNHQQGHRLGQPQHQQPQQAANRRAEHVIIVGDSDSETSCHSGGVLASGSLLPQNPGHGAAGASKRTLRQQPTAKQDDDGATGSFRSSRRSGDPGPAAVGHRQQAADRKPPEQQDRQRGSHRQSQDDVMIVGAATAAADDDVQLVGSKPGRPAPPPAAPGVTGTLRSSMQAVHRAVQRLQRNQQQLRQPPAAAQQQQQQQWPLQKPQAQQQQMVAAGQPAQQLQQIAPVQMHVHAPDGFVGARVQLHLEYPSYWDYSQPIQSTTVRLIELPLDGNVQAPPIDLSDPLEAAAAAAQLSQQDVDLIQQHGLSRPDVLASLLLADGDSDEALVRAATCADVGGAAAVWRGMNGGHEQRSDRQVQEQLRQQQEAAARRIAEEVESILSMFESTSAGSLNRSKVVSIERIQHARLWKRYCLKRQEIIEMCGADNLNERLLFHGTSPGIADRIAKEGFDFRLVVTAAYGNGTYFADHSSTALGYCAKQDPGAGAANAHIATGWRGAWPAMGAVFGAPPFAPPPSLAVPPPGAMSGMIAGGTAVSVANGGIVSTHVNYAKGGKRSRKAAQGAAAGQQVQQQRTTAGCYKMLVARVALGKQTTGTAGMRKPPEGYDSVNSGNTPLSGALGVASRKGGKSGRSSGRAGATWGAQQGKQYFCHVVFDNDQCYPEYLITFRPH